jgi:VanZ family protein
LSMGYKEKLRVWLPLIIWCAVIFIMSSLEINKAQEFSWLDFVFKKTAHVIEYAILYWLTYRAFSKNYQKIGVKALIISLIFSFFYALSDEWHQTFIAGREGTLRDVGFDSIGMLLSLNYLRELR